MGAGVSGTQGLGGLPNGDVIRQGAGNLPKRFYAARKFVRYLIALPGSSTKVALDARIASIWRAAGLAFCSGTGD
jgi:hypothetical protein